MCALKLVLHVFTSVQRYGYFRDELYYLDMAQHLDWGYVDAAPLVGVYAKIALWMGGSLAALRIIPALAGTALIASSKSLISNLRPPCPLLRTHRRPATLNALMVSSAKTNNLRSSPSRCSFWANKAISSFFTPAR